MNSRFSFSDRWRKFSSFLMIMSLSLLATISLFWGSTSAESDECPIGQVLWFTGCISENEFEDQIDNNPQYPNPFADVSDQRMRNTLQGKAIFFASHRIGALRGYLEKETGKIYFRETKNTNRAEVSKIISKVAEYLGKQTGSCGSQIRFPDVPNGVWYEHFVDQAVCLGVIEGYSDRTFGPANNVTRAELAVILKRLYDLSDYQEKTNKYTDLNDSRMWYSSLGNMITHCNMFPTKTGMLFPNEPATRGEIVTAIYQTEKNCRGANDPVPTPTPEPTPNPSPTQTPAPDITPTPTPEPTPAPDPEPSVNQHPIIESFTGPSTVTVGERNEWTVTARDPENAEIIYSMLSGEDGSTLKFEETTDTTARFSHTYQQVGTYIATVKVQDHIMLQNIYTHGSSPSTKTKTIRVIANSDTNNDGNDDNQSPGITDQPIRIEMSSSAQEVEAGAKNHTFGVITLHNQNNEDVTIRKISIGSSLKNGGIFSAISNVRLVNSQGITISGPVTSGSNINSLEDEFTLPKKSEMELILKADIADTVEPGQQYHLHVYPSETQKSRLRGSTSRKLYDVTPSTTLRGEPQTIAENNLRHAINVDGDQLPNQTAVYGQDDVLAWSGQLTNISSEDMIVDTISLKVRNIYAS